MKPDETSYDDLVHLIAPNGLPIKGTLERIAGRSNVLGFTRSTSGRLAPEYTGYTDVFWEEQHTARTRTGEIVVLDSDGNEWPISACEIGGEGESAAGEVR